MNNPIILSGVATISRTVAGGRECTQTVFLYESIKPFDHCHIHLLYREMCTQKNWPDNNGRSNFVFFTVLSSMHSSLFYRACEQFTTN